MDPNKKMRTAIFVLALTLMASYTFSASTLSSLEKQLGIKTKNPARRNFFKIRFRPTTYRVRSHYHYPSYRSYGSSYYGRKYYGGYGGIRIKPRIRIRTRGRYWRRRLMAKCVGGKNCRRMSTTKTNRRLKLQNRRRRTQKSKKN